jgi:hypothetical protein
MAIRDQLRRLRRRHARRPHWKTARWKLALALLVLVALAGWLVAKPGYARFRKWRLAQNYQEAVAANEDGNYARAFELGQALVLAGERRVEIYRVLEKAAGELQDGRYEPIAIGLLCHPQASSDDRLGVFRVLAPDAPFGRLQSLWMTLPEAERLDSRFRLAMSSRMLDDEAYDVAVRTLEKSPAAEDPESIRQRIRAWAGLATPDASEAAQNLIVKAWQADPESPADWCELIQGIPVEHLDPVLLGPLRPWLAKGRPGKPGKGELTDARIRWAMSSDSERNAWFPELAGRWKDSAPRELAAFLSAVDRRDLLIATFDDAAVANDAVLTRARLESLMRLDHDEDLALAVLLQGRTLDPVETHAWSAVAYQRNDDPARMGTSWRAAIETALTNGAPRVLLDIHRLAVRAGMRREAGDALVAAIKTGSGPLPAYDALAPFLDSLAREGLDTELVDIHTQYAKFEPWHPRLMARYCQLAAYFGLEDIAVLIKKLSAFAEQYPAEHQITAVMATLHLLAGQTADATESWSRLKLPLSELAVNFRAAHLATEVLAGRIRPDDPSIGNFPWNELLPCERERIRKILRLNEEEEQRKAREKEQEERQKAATPATTGTPEPPR